MTSLTAQLQAAEAGSRELDGAIRAQFFGDFFYCDYETGTSCGDAPDCSKDGCNKPLGIIDERTSLPRDWRDDDRLPAYSTSIDAALALIEEVLPGWSVNLEIDFTREVIDPETDLDPCACSLFNHDGDHMRHVMKWAKSPALALCLALLSAVEGGEADG